MILLVSSCYFCYFQWILGALCHPFLVIFESTIVHTFVPLYCSLADSKGEGVVHREADPPVGPIYFIFMQFWVKQLPKL